MAMVSVETLPCTHCGKTGEILVPETALERWKQGQPVQDALWMLSDEQREQLLTGMHPKCWDEVFSGPEF